MLQCSLSGPAQNGWPGPAQSKKIFQKNLSKNLLFSRVFFYQFCVIVVCIFILQKYKSGIKILGFLRNVEFFLKKNIVFIHTAKS